MGASIVARVDAAPVLEAREQVLDLVALPVEGVVIALLDFVLAVGRDARGDTALGEGVAQGDRAVGAVGEQVLGRRQIVEHRHGGLVVAGLAFGETQDERPALAVAHHVELAGQPAPAASDTSG